MRIGVDARSLRGSARSRGIARYLDGLLASMRRDFPDDALLLHQGSRGRLAAAALSGRPRLDRQLGGCDVVFLPGVAPVAVSAGVPYVLTVHDLSFEHRPRDFGAYERAWHRLARPRRLARRAARVIADSEAVRRQIVAEWGLAAERTVTIAPGPGRQAGTPVAPPAAVPERYVLAVGALEPRKRPDLLVEAHARARAAGLEAGLVLAGEGPMREQLAQSHATLLGYVEDDVLDSLYSGALALVCASREEGFGFTPLEAIARGTPALVSDLPVFSETLPEGALRVPPGDAAALADALLTLERDEGLRKRLVAEGTDALGRLSWRQAAARTRAVLAEAVE